MPVAAQFIQLYRVHRECLHHHVGADEQRPGRVEHGIPAVALIENVGVRPDIVVDYMTNANLMSAGGPFVQAFTDSAVKLAQAAAVPH